jgi:hypothetical protein
MARIRSIKPEFWTSEQVADCSPTARLLFVGLWTFSDDYGAQPYAPRTIKMQIFPGDPFTTNEIEGLLFELISAGLIKTYHIEDKRYLLITGWHHQKIEKPNQKYPPPIEFDDQSPTIRRPVGDSSPPDTDTDTDTEGIQRGEDKEDNPPFVPEEPKQGKRKTQKCEKEFSLPEYIPTEVWTAYIDIRVKKRAAKTDSALWLIIEELEKIKEKHGHNPVEVLKKSIRSGWTDVYPLKDGGGNGKSGSGYSSGKQTAPGAAGRAQSDGRPYPVDAEY